MVVELFGIHGLVKKKVLNYGIANDYDNDSNDNGDDDSDDEEDGKPHAIDGVPHL